MFTARMIINHLLNKIPSAKLFNFQFTKLNKSNFGLVVVLHRVTNPSLNAPPSLFNNFIEISDSNLVQIIEEFKKMNVQFISLNELARIVNEGVKPKSPIVHFSFDDGYKDNFTVAFPIFKKYNIPFSVFINSDFIDALQPFLWWYMIEEIIKNKKEVFLNKYNFSITSSDYKKYELNYLNEKLGQFLMENMEIDKQYLEDKILRYFNEIPNSSIPEILSWEQLTIMSESGLCEIGVHTKSHVRFKDLSLEEKAKEILECKETIKANTGVASKYFAFPYGRNEDIGDQEGLKELLAFNGLELALTTEAGLLNGETDKHFIPRIYFNDSATLYTLKSRLNGTYQREKLKMKMG